LADFFADFLADFFADFLADFFADFLADFFAAFLAGDFFAAFFAGDFFAAFLAGDFFAADFFAGAFLAAFFAVAITFLLDQVDMEPLPNDASLASGYSSPETAQEGRPSPMNRGAGLAALVVATLWILRILISLCHRDVLRRPCYSHDNAPPVW
jgi:hypothetical protein